jgi:uncharacterized membrane protein HdeD (DUF308 family)
MERTLRSDAADVLADVGRRWGWVLAFGIATLPLLLGIFWIVNGAIEVFTAPSHRRMPGRGWTIFMGLLSVVADVVVLA